MTDRASTILAAEIGSAQCVEALEGSTRMPRPTTGASIFYSIVLLRIFR
jgi:hypothetical protein